jgi:hypothetical protein
VRVLGPIIFPAARFLPVGVANDFHRSAVGSKFVGHQCMRGVVTLTQLSADFVFLMELEIS